MNKKLKSKKVCNLGKRGILGYHLGYPMCCIKSFENNINAFNSSDKQHIAFQIIENSGFGGYIPCHNCSEKILSGYYKKLTDIFDMNRRLLYLPIISFGMPPVFVERTIFPKICPEIENLCSIIDKNKVNITNKSVSKKYPFINLTEDEKIYIKYFERRIIKRINLKIQFHRSILSDDRFMTKKEQLRFSRKRKNFYNGIYFKRRKRRKIDKLL